MITKYNKFNEGINHLLVGPTDEEIFEELKDLKPQTLLEKSIIISFLPGIKKAIENGASLNEEEIIYTAALFGDEEIIKYLLNAGALVTTDVIIDITYELSDKFGNINKNKNIKNIELIKSYLKEEPKKVNTFKKFFNRFKSNENLNSYDKLLLNQELLKCIKLNDLVGVEDAISKGADIHTQNELPLYISSQNGFYDIVKFILDKGAIVDTTIINNSKDNVKNELKRKYLEQKRIRISK